MWVELSSIAMQFHAEVREVVQWSTRVPGLQSISTEDHERLLKGCFMDLCCFRLSYRSAKQEVIVIKEKHFRSRNEKPEMRNRIKYSVLGILARNFMDFHDLLRRSRQLFLTRHAKFLLFVAKTKIVILARKSKKILHLLARINAKILAKI